MSILIKGMDMPNDRPIIISIFPNGRVDTMEAKYFDSVLSAVEVPTPHGDLIDRDKLLSDIDHYHVSDGKFQHWTQVQNAVIESEE